MTRLARGPDGDRRGPVGDALHQIGEIARRVRAPHRQRARGRVGERHRVHRQRLDLPREHVGRDALLRQVDGEVADWVSPWDGVRKGYVIPLKKVEG